MRDHLKESHHWKSGSKGGRPKKSTSSAARELWTKLTMTPVCWQTFHRSNFFRFFQVTHPVVASQSPSMSSLLTAPGSMTAREQVEQQLAQKLQAREQAVANAALLIILY